MPDISKQEAFIKFKIKSTAIKHGWYIIYSILIPLFFAFLFDSMWILFAAAFLFYPLWLMITDIKRLRKELKTLRESADEPAKEEETQPREN